MHRFLRGSALALALLAVVAVSLSAADKEARKGKKRQAKAVEKLFELPASIELTAEQQEKVAKLKEQYAPKLAESQKKINAIVSADQRKAQQEAEKAAKAAGKKGREAREEGIAALKLSPEEKAKYEQARSEQQQIQNEARTALRAVLTPEQKAELPGRGKGKGKGKNNNNNNQ